MFQHANTILIIIKLSKVFLKLLWLKAVALSTVNIKADLSSPALPNSNINVQYCFDFVLHNGTVNDSNLGLRQACYITRFWYKAFLENQEERQPALSKHMEIKTFTLFCLFLLPMKSCCERAWLNNHAIPCEVFACLHSVKREFLNIFIRRQAKSVVHQSNSVGKNTK